MNSEIINTIYKNVYIEYDACNEEWVTSLDFNSVTQKNIFKKNPSLKKIKESIDRFLTKSFDPIPIIFFDSDLNFIQADIISFTNNVGECWIKKNDDTRGLIKTVGGLYPKKIYAAGNEFNEPKMLKFFELNEEKNKIQSQLDQVKKEIIETISGLDKYDISGMCDINQ